MLCTTGQAELHMLDLNSKITFIVKFLLLFMGNEDLHEQLLLAR